MVENKGYVDFEQVCRDVVQELMHSVDDLVYEVGRCADELSVVQLERLRYNGVDCRNLDLYYEDKREKGTLTRGEDAAYRNLKKVDKLIGAVSDRLTEGYNGMVSILRRAKEQWEKGGLGFLGQASWY